MCGILGTVSAQGDLRPADHEAGLASLSHRGPDGQSTWYDQHCFLGHRRLAIIDLSKDADEPLPNEDSSVWLNFNGEIYNFRELRTELEGLGHRFRSKTDAEVALHAYEQWGTGSVERLKGMFAYAVWDAPKRRLFAARDRLGKKPFFYSEGEVFRFASELQGLLAMSSATPSIDREALDYYLSFGYIPAPLTGFEGLRKLSPAHWMTVQITEGRIETIVERYWNLAYLPKVEIDEREASERLRSLVSDAVSRRLVSDRPLGAFLSGGIDSSIVVGLMAKLSKSSVKTFSVGFKEQAYSELGHARRIAQKWDTDHHEFVVEPDAAAVLPLLVRHYGEPYADSSAIPSYYLAQATSEHVTVALNGDGGDESFGGYERHWANVMAHRIGRFPGLGPAGRAFGRIVPDSGERKSIFRKVNRFLETLGSPLDQRYRSWVSFFGPEQKDRLLNGTERGDPAGVWFSALCRDTDGLGPLDSALSIDLHSNLPGDLLVKVDIASMANSLECRSPFLDQDVLEFAALLPERFKINRGVKKALLRDTFTDLLPEENVRRPKSGFAVPMGDWLRGPLREMVGDTLLGSNSRVSELLDATEVDSVVKSHLAGHERSSQVWSLLMLELWMREMVDRPLPKRP